MKEIEEHLEVVALRVPPGDNWKLMDIDEPIEGLVQALTAYMRATRFKGSYKLDPLGGKLYAIKETTVEVEEKVPQKWDLYGEG